MNPEVEPCDNFYEFACGGFEKATTIPDDKTSVNTFSVISDKLQEQLRASIEEPSREGERKPFTLAKNLYKACMNKSEGHDGISLIHTSRRRLTFDFFPAAIEKAGFEPLHKILRQLGTWPVLEGDNWKEDQFSWVDSVYRFRKLGYSVDYFIDFSIGVDLKNSTKRIIDVS